MEVFGQNNGGQLSIALNDFSGNAATPLTASYKIIDLQSGTVERDTTSLTPSSVLVINLSGSDTAINNSANDQEIKRLILTTTYSSNTPFNGIYDYLVQNYGL